MNYFYNTFFLLMILSTALFASKNDSTQAITSYRLNEQVIVDGILNESVYSNPAVTTFTQKDPQEGKPISEKSEVWVSHDDYNIYISGRFSDSNPELIDVTLMRRDNVVESDWFFVYLDTYNDDRTGYLLCSQCRRINC